MEHVGETREHRETAPAEDHHVPVLGQGQDGLVQHADEDVPPLHPVGVEAVPEPGYGGVHAVELQQAVFAEDLLEGGLVRQMVAQRLGCLLRDARSLAAEFPRDGDDGHDAPPQHAC